MPVGELTQAIIGRLLDLRSNAGEDYSRINEIVSVILQDGDISLFLSKNTKKEEGLRLGNFFCGGGPPNNRYVDYGLAIKHDGQTEPQFFTLSRSCGSRDEWTPLLELSQGFPEDYLNNGWKRQGEDRSFPTPQVLVSSAIKAFLDPDKHIFNYEEAKKNYRELARIK